MKRILLLASILLICTLILSGCGISENMRNNIISLLQDEKIISDNWTLEDTVVEVSHGNFPGPMGYYYIYSDTHDKLHAIEIHDKIIEDEKEYYYVYVYDDVEVDESIGKILSEEEYVKESITYSYDNGIERDKNIYLFEDGIRYNIYVEEKLGIKFYKVKEYK